MKHKHSMTEEQQGFVSIIVAMFFILFVSLVALGFAFLVRQNQEQNQNRLFSTQAFYAAESGVNDAVDYLSSYLKTNKVLPSTNKTDCSTPIGTKTGTIGSSNAEIKYTCVLYQIDPSSLEYTISNKNSRMVRVQAAGTKPLKTITIGWQDSDNANKNFATNTQHLLPQSSFTDDPAKSGDPNNLAFATDLLRATVIPVYPSISRASLQTGSQTLFLYPNKGSGTASTNPFLATANDVNDPNQGKFADGNCNANTKPSSCNVTITNLDSINGGTTTFYLRLRGFYRPSTPVIITATTEDGPAKLINEQAVIDSTGKAVNVLRRIQVRVPLAGSANRPEFAIESTDALCKRLQVWPNDATISSPLTDGVTIPESCKAF